MPQRFDELARVPELPIVAPTEQTAAAPSGEEGFQSKDQSGNDPRDFTTKFMPYHRYTELENGVEVSELALFRFYVFTGLLRLYRPVWYDL